MVDIKPIYLNECYLFQNKINYLDKIYFCFAKIKLFKHTFKKETLAQVFSCEFCEISKNTFYRTPLGDYFWASNNVPLQCLHTAKSLLVLVGELVKLFCSNYWQSPKITAAVHYFHYNSHQHHHYHHFHYHWKMHLYRLKTLLTIPLYCNMISYLFQSVFFLQVYIFL